MDEFPIAQDYTRIVKHRSKQATMQDINLSGMPGGGLDLPAAGWGFGVGLIAAAVSFLILVFSTPSMFWVLGVVPGVVVGAIVYWIVQHDDEGRDGIFDRLKGQAVRLKQPKAISGLDNDNSVTSFRWETIVAREPGARAPSRVVRRFSEYGYVDNQLAQPVQRWAWPAADESIDAWLHREREQCRGEVYNGETLTDERRSEPEFEGA